MSDFWFVSGGAALPLVSFVCGLILWKAPPARNSLFGYRTKLSLQNDRTWYIAQTLAGKRLTAVFAPTAVVFAAVCVFVAANKYSGDVKYWMIWALVIIGILELAAVNISVEKSLRSADKRR